MGTDGRVEALFWNGEHVIKVCAECECVIGTVSPGPGPQFVAIVGQGSLPSVQVSQFELVFFR